MSEREAVRVGQSPVRCPFCHEDVQVAEEDWVACAGCLARHHGECWTEAGRCGACQGTGSLTKSATGPATVTAPPPPPPDPDSLGRAVPWSSATPRTIAYSRTIDGEVGEDTDEAVITEIRRRLGTHGRFERLGRTLTWMTQVTGTPQQGNPGRLVTVTVASRDGKTTLDVTEDLAHQVLGARVVGVVFGILGGMMGLAGALNATQSGWVALAAVLAVLAVVLYLARLVFVKPYRRARPELAALTEALERELRARVRRRDPKAD